MAETLNLIGALCAVWIYSFSILVFLARLRDKLRLERAAGILLFISALPLLYLILTAGQYDRPVLYSIQIGFMLLWIVIAIVVDYILKLEFRGNLRWVIAYVMVFFAGTGGMLGVASLAGTAWMAVAASLFFIMAGLAFYQRAKTGK